MAVVDPDSTLIASYGDIDRPFFIRSSAKPFQALVAQEAGAGLGALELAMACASHRGLPAHIALVGSMLAAAGLGEGDLRCPPGWPLRPEAARLVQRAGESGPRRIWHNCSGKHAGFLRACVANGWPTETYLDPGHPLQQRVISTVSELGSYPTEPVGVDGCGAPVLRTTTRALATLYSRLACDDRLEEVFGVMHRYPALVGANGEGDTEMAIACNAVAKGGAAGCLGVGVRRRFGIGVKSWDGIGAIANVAGVATLAQLGVPSDAGLVALEPVMRPPTRGGGRLVGETEPTFELERL